MKQKGLPLSALDPSGQSQCELTISEKQVTRLRDKGPVSKFHELGMAMDVLKEPSAIYVNLKRGGKEKGLCYIGTPRQRGDWWDAPPVKGFVFAVYVSENRVVYEWGWEREDGKNPGAPVGSKNRYGSLIYGNTK